MGSEINLLKNYPKTKRNPKERGLIKSKNDQLIARKFDKDFFDGDRSVGYGGFYYNPKYWENVIPTLVDYYNLKRNSKILDVGCAKGFMLYDFKRLYPDMEIFGIDISEYAIKNSMPEIKKFLKVGNCKDLPYKDNFFDLVISINTIHNLKLTECKKSLLEISRVSKKNSFIVVDAYSTDEEKKRMYDWNLTALTIMSKDNWKKFFKESLYDGDYYWFTP